MEERAVVFVTRMSGERLGFLDGHGNLTAVRSGIGHRISGMSAIDGGANRRFRTDDAVIRGDGQVSRAKHVHHFTSVDFKGH